MPDDASNITPFPRKPSRPDRLTFWHVAGDIIWCGVPIEVRQAFGLREIYRDESRAAFRQGDLAASAAACKLWCEITRALDALDAWCRTVGRPSPYANPNAEVSSRLKAATEDLDPKPAA